MVYFHLASVLNVLSSGNLVYFYQYLLLSRNPLKIESRRFFLASDIEVLLAKNRLISND